MWFKDKQYARIAHSHTAVISAYFFAYQPQEELIKHFNKEKIIEDWLSNKVDLVKMED